MQQALTALLQSAQGDAIAFRRTAEQWFDDHMEPRLWPVQAANPAGPGVHSRGDPLPESSLCT